MKKVASGATTVKGLDCSHYDQVIDFAKVKSAGFEFAFGKCTEYNADKVYARNKAYAQASGILFGAYHFFHPSRDARAQADLFLKIAKIVKGDLQPVLDWESTDGVPSMSDRTRAKVWLDIVEKAVGKAPIIYGAPFFLQALGLDESFKRYPLWVAHYGTKSPLVPSPWDTWSFWQSSDKGSVPGIPAANDDLDVFNGSIENLRKMTV